MANWEFEGVNNMKKQTFYKFEWNRDTEYMFP